MSLKILFSDQERPYTGVELRPHFLLTELGLKGSAVGAFIGPCQVKTEHMVDWEDRLNHDHIAARSMVHFLGEFFGITLREGVLAQRLFVAIAQQALNARLEKFAVVRDGDDLFWDRKKLTVSIVTASPVSQLLHFGINIDSAGAPVAAAGLKDLGVDPAEWASEVLKLFCDEWESLEWACAKVRPVV